MDAPFQATHQTKRMLYEMMLCAEHRGAYVGYVRGEFSRTLTGFFQEVSSAFRFPFTLSFPPRLAVRQIFWQSEADRSI